MQMKKILGIVLFMILLIILVLSSCGKYSAEISEFEQMDDTIYHEMDNSETEEHDSEDMDDMIHSEKLILDTNYRISRYDTIFVFDDVIFIRNHGYQYIDGRYCSTGEKLTDYILLEDRDDISELLENGVISVAFQSGNLIICKEYLGIDRGYRITFIEFPNREIKGSYIIHGYMHTVYKEKVYYVAENKNELGETFYTMEYLDMNDFSTHVIYSSEKYISDIMAREDGAIAFLVYDEGCFIMDSDGNIQHLHEQNEISWHHPEIIEKFDETGVFLWVEYYYNSEWNRITMDGSMYRIRNRLNDIVTDVGMVEVENYEAKLYPFEYETWTVDQMDESDLPARNAPLKEYQILDEAHQEQGYSLMDYICQDETIWWIWEYEDELFITKTELDFPDEEEPLAEKVALN